MKLSIPSVAFTLALMIGSGSVSAEVTYADYLRADSILTTAKKAYSATVSPKWLGDSHYFWYKNHEKGGDCYYLVNAATGKKQKAADKKGLVAFLPKKQKNLAEELLKEDDQQRRGWFNRDHRPKPVV